MLDEDFEPTAEDYEESLDEHWIPCFADDDRDFIELENFLEAAYEDRFLADLDF